MDSEDVVVLIVFVICLCLLVAGIWLAIIGNWLPAIVCLILWLGLKSSG